MLRTLTLAIVLGLAAPAVAQTAAPTLKRNVTVASDIVRIGDLFDNAGARANIAVFRAPDPGQTGSVSTKAIVDAVRAHDMYLFDTAHIEQVSVTHEGRAITSKDILDRIAAALAEQPGLGTAENLNVTSDTTLSTIHVDVGATGTLQISRLQYEPRTRRFFAIVVPPSSDAARPTPIRISGTVVEMVEAAVLARNIATGDIIKADDVTIERRPKYEAGLDIVVEANSTVGLAAKRALRVGQVLRNADLVKPDMVVRNESVTLVYQVPGIVLSARGKAVESGREGDTVNVLNIQTKRTIQGIVTGPGRVTVTAQTPRATNLASASLNGIAPRRTAE